MKLISRYISTTIISTILLILLILMGLELLISFIGQLSDIGTGNYNLPQAMRYIMLDMPYQLYNFIPMAGLIGSLVGLGVLANQSELIVMQAAGFSKAQIAGVVLKAAIVMALLALFLGEAVAPAAERTANMGKVVAESGGQALTTAKGTWIRQDNNFIHIGAVLNKYHLQNITIYAFNPRHQLDEVQYAANAVYTGNKWQLEQVKRTAFLGSRTRSQSLTTEIWDIAIKPNLLSLFDEEPRNMSLPKLYQYINYLKTNGLQSTLYEFNFWKRVIQPVATLVMIFLAVPFIFGSLRSVPMGVRVLTGVTVGFAFYILNQFFGPLSLLFQIPPVLGAVLPTSLFLLVSMVLLWRMR